MLIGITGKLGTGKDYISQHLIEKLLNIKKEKYIQLAFADQIKINVMTKKNIPYDQVYINKTTKTRRLLQIEGTEEGRNSLLGKEIWVNYLDNWINVFKNRKINTFIISDCRFKNEFDYIKKNNGILIKVIAPNRNYNKLIIESNGDLNALELIKNHISECDLDDIPLKYYDLVIYNDFDTLYDLNSYSDDLTKLLTL